MEGRVGEGAVGREPRRRGRGLLLRGAHLGVLWAFAVAQPLFDLLGRNPEFFATRGSPGGDIVAFALLVALAPPLALLGLEALAGLLDRRLAWLLHLALLGALAGALALQALEPATTAPGVAVALGAGAAAVAAYARLRAVRSFLSALAPAPLAFAVLFLAVSDVSRLVLSGTPDVRAAPVTGSGAPVVLVILDELSVHSLMDRHGRIDASRYPSFARLAADATFYRNTVSVHQDTPYAAPAILDGRMPRRDRLPVAADHPRSIFSLLAGSYRLHVREEATALCPPALCGGPGPGFGARMGSLWDDLSVVYAHLVLPDELGRELAPVDQSWGGFGVEARAPAAVDRAVARTAGARRETRAERRLRLHANMAEGRPARWRGFVAGIRRGGGPGLHVLHALLPHVPYRYLPSGRAYRLEPGDALPGLSAEAGYRVPFLVRQALQRHLLQLAATDRLLGTLLDRLERLGIYDRALVAVVADHGVSFQVGHERRLVRPGNVAEIAPVPFILKAPGQSRGRASDKPLRTIDVLPTIADVLDVRIPWEVDGRSALLPTSPAQRRRRIIGRRFEATYPIDTPSYERRWRALLARNARLLARGPYAVGPRPDLVGRPVAAPPPAPSGAGRARIADAERYRSVDPASGLVPAHVVGTIEGGGRGGGRVVAVAVNGRIEATGITFTLEGGEEEQLSVLVPERSLRPGPNRVEVLLVRGGELLSLGGAGAPAAGTAERP